MPTTYSHYAFGQDVFTLLKPGTQREILPYMDLYHLGVHGPDILFYYHVVKKNTINQYGVKVHHEPARDFFEHALKVYKAHGDKRKARAYLAGFMTHFILDSTCHPYIRKRIRQTGISHTEIETGLDMILMRKNGLNPASYKPACHMRGRWDYARVIAPYFCKTTRQFLECILDMKLVINHIFRSHFGLKRWVLDKVGGRFYPRLNLIHYYVKPEINPANEETCMRLLGLYRGCQEECAAMIEELFLFLDGKNNEFIDHPRLKKMFS